MTTTYAVLPRLGTYASGDLIGPVATYANTDSHKAEEHARSCGLLVLEIEDGDDPGPWRGHWLDHLQRQHAYQPTREDKRT